MFCKNDISFRRERARGNEEGEEGAKRKEEEEKEEAIIPSEGGVSSDVLRSLTITRDL